MIISTMRFKGYAWQHNPLSVEITHRRVQTEHVMPFFGTEVDDMGRRCRVIKGKGELVGVDCIEQYKEIERLFLKGETGVLSVPSLKPMYARFSALSAEGSTAPDMLTYTFEFTEADSTSDERAKPDVYVCSGKETLFDIAYEADTTVDALVNLNPWVRRPDELSAGERVRLC